MIKVRGWQVSPAELEAALLFHPNISDAAVIGVRSRHDEDAELPRAYVVSKPRSPITEDEVRAFMAVRVARFKNLDGGVVFVNTIPRSSTGKILKNVLRERAAVEVNDAPVKIEKTCMATSEMATGRVAPNKISADSSIISCEGYNESDSRSRQNSTSTADTVYSERSNQTSGPGFPTTSANVYVKNDINLLIGINPNLQSGYAADPDLRSCSTRPITRPHLLAGSEHSHPLHTDVGSPSPGPNPVDKSTNLYDSPSTQSPFNKRAAEATKSLDLVYKKMKSVGEETLSEYAIKKEPN